MRSSYLFLSLALAFAGGCAGEVKHSDPGPNHPANPSAAEAPSQPPSQTLAVDEAVIPSDGERGVVPPEVRKATTAPAGTMLYACPMHADVTSTNPNDRCSKCGMKVNKPVKPTTAPAEQHQHDHGGGNK
jgi:hypothetical protein